jgi:acyl-CoA synthetase (AMP-forming)/AMP-acid ligase II
LILGKILEYSARKYPENTALVYDGEEISYLTLHQRANKLSNALLRLASEGDRIALLSQNRPEIFEVLYGVPTAGMTVTILNYRLNFKEIAWIINDSAATVVILEEEYLGELESVKELIPTVKHIITFSSGKGDSSYEDILEDASSVAPNIPVDENNTVWLVYTSGTTGMPKGAMLSHKNLSAGMLSLYLEWGIKDGDSYIVPFPLCHIAAFTCMAYHIRGCRVVVMRRYDAEMFLSNIENYHGTATIVAPTMLAFLLDHPKVNDYKTDSLRSMMATGAPSPVDLVKRAVKRFGNVFIQGYSMTETPGTTVIQTPLDTIAMLNDKPHLTTSAGKANPLFCIRIVNDNMEDLPPGEIGEIVIQGDHVFKGYWNKPNATEEAFSDGWFHSGDLGKMDEEGNVYVVDRKKDMIITGAENVYSREVEDVIYGHPAVNEVAVLGIPDETWGENVLAVIITHNGKGVSEEEIISYSRERLAKYKCPKRVVFTDEIPKTVNGKVIKHLLRDRYK